MGLQWIKLYKKIYVISDTEKQHSTAYLEKQIHADMQERIA